MRLLPAVLACLLALAGCGGTRWQAVHFTYTAPSETTLPPSHQRFASTFQGEGFDRTYSRLPLEQVGQLTRTADVDEAEVVVDVIVGSTSLTDVRAEPTGRTVDVGGARRPTWRASGALVTPCRIEVYDRPANIYHRKEAFSQRLAMDVEHDVTGGDILFDETRARLVLALEASRCTPAHRDAAGDRAQRTAVETLVRLFSPHPVSMELPLPSSHKRRPELAEARAVLAGGLDSDHGRQALAIYRSVSGPQLTEKGEPDRDLEYAIAIGEATAAFLADDLDGAREALARARRIDPRGQRGGPLEGLLR